jgi:cytochrome c553
MKQYISRKEALTVFLFASLVLGSGAVGAEGDYNAGARKSFYCAYCHGYDGNPLDTKTPRLAGQKAEYIIARIKALEASGGMHQDMLQAIRTGNLGDADIVNLATFYARQPVRGKQ